MDPFQLSVSVNNVGAGTLTAGSPHLRNFSYEVMQVSILGNVFEIEPIADELRTILTAARQAGAYL